MRMNWYAPAFAGLLALTACGGMMGGKKSESPTASAVGSSQQTSQKALENASKAQERASEQAEKTAEAQREVQEAQTEVQKAQQRLTQAQEKLKQEQEKAQQLQQQASQETQQAAQTAQQSQQQAQEQLSRQGEQIESGQLTVSGQVTRVDAQEIEVRPEGGDALKLKLTPQTQVQIDGRQAQPTEIVQGTDARVAYQVSEQEPTAVLVQVTTGLAPTTGTGSTGSSSTSGTGTSGSTSQRQHVGQQQRHVGQQQRHVGLDGLRQHEHLRHRQLVRDDRQRHRHAAARAGAREHERQQPAGAAVASPSSRIGGTRWRSRGRRTSTRRSRTPARAGASCCSTSTPPRSEAPALGWMPRSTPTRRSPRSSSATTCR